jgi:hypothetical protein
MRNYSSTAVQTELVGSLTAVATSATVAADSGFPATPFTLVIDPDTVNEEIITVTARSGTNLSTIVRGQDGTAAVSHGAEAVVKHMVTARDLQEAQNHIEATSDIHGVTGALAGASNTMVFSNKTISGSNNTLSDIAQGSVTGLTTALNLKAPLANPTFTGTVVLPATTSIGDVDATEIGHLNGVTSAVQTQINDLQVDIDDVAADLLGLDAIVADNTTDIATLQTEMDTAQADILGLDSSKQNADIDLTAIAGLASTGIVVRTGDGTAAVRTIQGSGAIGVAYGNGVVGNPVISVTGTIPTKLAAGNKTVSVVSSNVGTDSISISSFGFTAAPIVTAVGDSGLYNVAVTAVSSTNIDIVVRHIENTSATTDVVVRWIAVQI